MEHQVKEKKTNLHYVYTRKSTVSSVTPRHVCAINGTNNILLLLGAFHWTNFPPEG